MGSMVLVGRVIDGISDNPIEDGVVLINDEIIEFVGKYEEVQISENAKVIHIKDGTILPGFIDCHAHLLGGGPEKASDMSYPKEYLILNAAHEVGILLDAGFTGLRDMSSFGYHINSAIERGVLRGPRIFPGGKVLSPTAGHVDVEPWIPKDYFEDRTTLSCLVDGVEGCLRGVRSQFREGARFIKVCATGGVSSPMDGLDDVQFSDEELKVIVDEAKRHGTYVAAHCTGTAGTKQALRLGVECIEHGVMLDEECVNMMKEKDCTLVTTLSVSFGVAKIHNLPKWMKDKAMLCADANRKSIKMIRSAGVRVALGTDFSNSPTSPYKNNGKEFASIVEGGFTPMEAIKIGTINGAYLMKMEDQIGSLEKGKLGDVVIVQGNPLEDIRILGDSDNIKVVIKNGNIEKFKSEN